VTLIAAATGVEEFPAALGGGVNGARVARDEVIEWRIERQLRSLVGRDRPQQVGPVGPAAKDLLEGVLVFADRRDPGHGSIETRLAHFNRIGDGQRRLLFERCDPPSQNCVLL